MPADIRVIHAQDFIKATADGDLDFEASKKALIEIVSAAADVGAFEILLDTRKSHGKLSVTNLWYLADELDKLRETYSGKTAVLCPTDRFDDAAFFALCSQNRGLRVKVFTSFEDAINWLIGMVPDA